MTQFYVTPFYQDLFQSETLKFLAHTYTKQSRTPIMGTAGVDEWGQPTYTYPPPIHGLPCYYVFSARPVHQPYGIISANTPTLIVPFSDNLQPGDYVFNISTRGDAELGIAPICLLGGPTLVETGADQAPNVGGAIFRQFSLINIEVVPTELHG